MVAVRLALTMAVCGALSAPPSLAEPSRANDWVGTVFGADIQAPSAGPQISIDDLVRLRDIGGFDVSPDGRWLAFSVYQGVPETNRYAMRWFIWPTDASALPRAIDQDGGQPISTYSYGLPVAFIPQAPPKWSPDSSRFAVRRLVGHRVELWVVDASTGRAHLVADGQAQVEAFGWSGPGKLLFRTGLDYDRFVSNLEIEAKNGWLLDGRTPLFAARMKPTQPDCVSASDAAACSPETRVWEEGTSTRLATAEEAALLAPGSETVGISPIALPGGDRRAMAQRRLDGSVVWLTVERGENPQADAPLRRVATTGPFKRRCASAACVGSYFKDLGWTAGGRSVWFLKAEDSGGRADGGPQDQTALYEWRLDSREVRAIAKAERLDNCQVRARTAYCLRETITQPAHIVAIDFDSSEQRTIVDPNPVMATKAFPKVRKLRLTDFDGNPGTAYVVLPNGYAPGRAYPLVVTQYRQRGFLRGATGNEYPILPLAAAGFVVLSIDRPEEYALMRKLAPADIDRRRLTENLRDRRRVLEVYERTVDGLVDEGLVDPSRVGMTGLSGGAETTHYALQHSDRFAVAIASSGVQDSSFLALIPEGPWRTHLMRMFGTESLFPPAGNALEQLSWSKVPPERLRSPLLVNEGEYEGMIGFEGLQALQHAKRPIEVRVFPDEMHAKYHPRSIAGVFENNMMWLKFWLLGEESAEARFSDQYRRWEEMRERLGHKVDFTRSSPASPAEHFLDRPALGGSTSQLSNR